MKILNRAQIRTAEENAVNSGIFSFPQLMNNAGNAFVNRIMQRYNIIDKKVIIVCGKGNNGGDGLVIANLLFEMGAQVFLSFPLGKPKTETAEKFLDCVKSIPVADTLDGNYDFVIDALFGIGLERPLEKEALDTVCKMNEMSGIKIAVDLPSGVPCNAEFSPETAFRADYTVTFIALKPCFVLPLTSEFCGEFEVEPIDIFTDEYSYQTITEPQRVTRPHNSHKGSYGTALLLCGSYGMCGAQILSSRAALRSGAGLLKTFVCDKNYSAFVSSVPEAVTLPVPTNFDGLPQVTPEQFSAAAESASAILIGCGLGFSESAVSLVKKVLSLIKNKPIIIDADGINAVATDINIIRQINAPVILTPHPKEMSRLCHTTVSNIEKDRVGYAREFAVGHACTVVLKGHNTIVAFEDGSVYFNITGNPGMATGGSGDVLAGMIVSYLAAGVPPEKAALNAVYIHGLAGDSAAKHITERALLPTDIIEELTRMPY